MWSSMVELWLISFLLNGIQTSSLLGNRILRLDLWTDWTLKGSNLNRAEDIYFHTLVTNDQQHKIDLHLQITIFLYLSRQLSKLKMPDWKCVYFLTSVWCRCRSVCDWFLQRAYFRPITAETTCFFVASHQRIQAGLLGSTYHWLTLSIKEHPFVVWPFDTFKLTRVLFQKKVWPTFLNFNMIDWKGKVPFNSSTENWVAFLNFGRCKCH